VAEEVQLHSFLSSGLDTAVSLKPWTLYSWGKSTSTVISELEAVRVPELERTFWKTKSLALAKNQTLDHPVCSLVNTLSHLLKHFLLKYQQKLSQAFHVAVFTEKATVPTVNPEAQTPSHIQFFSDSVTGKFLYILSSVCLKKTCCFRG
jgi:hypothetical protein